MKHIAKLLLPFVIPFFFTAGCALDTMNDDDSAYGNDGKSDGLMAPKSCTSTVLFACEVGFECVDDPNDKCEPFLGNVDCREVCLPDDGDGLHADPTCDSSVAISCEVGFECVDDPNDKCEPFLGDTDCHEVCLADETTGDGIDPDNGSQTDQPCDSSVTQSCLPGFECVDDPNDECKPYEGDIDCYEVCL